MRSLFIFSLLLVVKALSWLFYSMKLEFLGETQPNKWRTVRLIALLNHTSLFEPLLTAKVPVGLLWRIAAHGVIPAAAKTMDRPVAGLFYRLFGRKVIPISRQRDKTWTEVLESIAPDSMVIILPEGRMKRADGLDSEGQPMTVRGGIADMLEAIPSGVFLIAYSGGMHHIQAPGEGTPRLFKRIRMKVETLTVEGYRDEILAVSGEDGFKKAVIADLERRRDEVCPPMEAELKG